MRISPLGSRRGLAQPVLALLGCAPALLVTPLSASPQASAPIGVATHGEVVDPALHGPSWIESMDAVIAREAALPAGPQPVRRMHDGSPGRWQVPSRKATVQAHSGEHYATVTWGDPRIGLGFDGDVALAGAWVLGQGAPNAWPAGLRAVGFRAGSAVATTPWFTDFSSEPAWFAMDLANVDFAVFEVQGRDGADGWFGLDDLTFTRSGADAPTVVTFDDLPWRFDLTGSSYAGLVWTEGSGEFAQAIDVVHPPLIPPGLEHELVPPGSNGNGAFAGGGATAPTLGTSFRGPRISDAGAGWLPPDTCGAVGLQHYLSVVNQHMSVYDKTTGQRLVNVSLQSFFNTGGSAGDPRVVYDHYAGRWIVIAGDFNNGVRFAYSLSDDATGSWFKSFLTFSAGSDAGNWPDYTTLGFDQEGIYMSAYMVGGNFLMSLFALDKAPLLTGAPSLGTLTAWRQLPWEGAIQPCVTYEDPGPEFVVSRAGSTSLRLRRIDGPLASPTMTELGFAATPQGSTPPAAPALGSSPDLSTVDARPMNAVYRLGSVWTANTVSVNGRAAARWYEIDVASVSTNQVGTIQDATFSYYFPTIAVTQAGGVGLGFSGSSPNDYPGAYYTGRLVSDPAGQMAPPIEYQPGLAPYNGGGGNPQRFGDYSMTAVDPADGSLWTIQEYSDSNQSWSTWVAQLVFPPQFPPPFSYCTAKVNSAGFSAIIDSIGTPSFTQPGFTLTCVHLLPFKNGLTFWGTGQAAIPFLGGTLCTNPPLARGPIVPSDGFGISQYVETFAIDDIGTTRDYQWWYRDPAAADGTGVGLSDAREIVIEP